MKISINSIVRNEERFLWYAVLSVIEHVEEVLLWDTGSSDQTPEVITALKERYPEKINFRQIGEVDKNKFSLVRQEMLEKSTGDWIWILDGDEIWWEDSVGKIISTINKSNCDAIVCRFTNLIGDPFYYQEESAGRYKIDGKTGNLTIRVFKKNIPGLAVVNAYGAEGYIDSSGFLIQESTKIRRKFVDAPFLHATHLARSRKDSETMGRRRKVKHEIGKSFPLDFYYPEVFFRPRPAIVESPWKVMDPGFKFISYLETPLRKIKRRLWWGKAGY
jgi:glycosyltransferase involved in cell wall biosynthesis